MGAKLAVLLSGSGTTLENVFEKIDSGALDAEVGCVVSSRSDAYGLERASKRDVPTAVFVRKSYPDTAAFSEDIWNEIRKYDVDLVILAGFMCLLRIPDDFENKVMNVHPALIPAFCGKGMYGHHVHEAVLESGSKLTGVTVHFVDNEYDNGPIILQDTVPVLSEDTPDTLAERVQAKERELYPKAMQLFAEGKLSVIGRKVVVES